MDLKNGMILCHNTENTLAKVIDFETKGVRYEGKEENTTLESIDDWHEATPEELEGSEFAPKAIEENLDANEA